MTTLESSSAVESSMEETSQTLPNRYRRRKGDELNGGGEDDADDEEGKYRSKAEECDKEVWNTLSDSFRRVQSVLDQNRVLIQQVNENHQSKIPDNLAKNVALIQEINGNISKVMSLYSDLSVNFSNVVHQRRSIVDSKNDDDDGSKEGSEGC